MQPRNVAVLAVAQALVMSGGPIVILCAGILGRTLAPSPALATVPITFFVIGNAVATLPVVLCMQRFGRRGVFFAMTVVGAAGATLAGEAVRLDSFWLLSAGTAIMGTATSAAQQFRFAAIESVTFDRAPVAAARVLLGGLAAAVIGPEVAFRFSGYAGSEWAGSFFAAAALYLGGLLVLVFYRPVTDTTGPEFGSSSGRTLTEIARGRTFLTAVVAGAGGYAVMSFVMTATPLHMHASNFSAAETKTVIQSHIVAMFLPSFVAGFLIRRFGLRRLLFAGLVCMLLTVALGVASSDLLGHWLALVLLGVGWNFLFLCGTTMLPLGYRPEEKFRAQALNDFTTFGVQALVSTLAGAVLAGGGWAILLATTLPVLFLQGLAFARWRG